MLANSDANIELLWSPLFDVDIKIKTKDKMHRCEVQGHGLALHSLELDINQSLP